MYRPILSNFTLTLLLGLISCSSLFAQIELNVKFAQTGNELREFLDRNDNVEIRATQIPSNIVQKYAFARELNQAYKLVKNNSTSSPEITKIYTLSFSNEQTAAVRIAQLNASGAFEWVEENRKVGLDEGGDKGRKGYRGDKRIGEIEGIGE